MASINKRLDSATNLLRSDKIKDRSAGLASFQELFALSKVVAFLAPEYDENHKLVDAPLYDIFQAVFNAVVIERAATLKGGATAAAERRLAETTRTLRFMIERSAHILDRGTVRSILIHVQQTIVVRSRVYQTLAADYVKILKAVLQHRPHREHLQPKTWYQPAALCFAGILGASVRVTSGWANDPPLADEEDEDELDDEDEGRPRKRAKLLQPSGATTSSRSSSTPAARAPPLLKAVATPVIREFASCLDLLFQSPAAPILTHADNILEFFVRYFATFPNETTAHVDILKALHRVLSELELNASSTLHKYAPMIWPMVVSLWNTKSEPLQDQVILVLTYMFPFALGGDSDVDLAHTEARLRPLSDLVSTAPRNVDDLLPSSCLSFRDLRTRASGGLISVFGTTIFTSGAFFSVANARTWATLELGGDVLARLCKASEEDVGSKVGRPLQAFLDELTLTSGVPTVLHRVKLLLFALDRHWDDFSSDTKSLAWDQLAKLLSASSHAPALQNWVFICLSAFASRGFRPDPVSSTHTSPSKRAANQPSSVDWSPVWSIALRKVLSPSTARAASFLALQILAAQLVDLVNVAADLESLLRDLSVQAPPPPSDAICMFLSTIAEVSENDFRLSKSQTPAAIADWLVISWTDVERALKQPADQVSLEGFNASSVVHLLNVLCGTPLAVQPTAQAALPDCPISEAFSYRAATATPRLYLLSNVLADAVRPSAPTSSMAAPGDPAASNPPTVLQRRLSSMLRRAIESFVVDLNGRGVSRGTLSAAAAALAVGVVTTSLLHEAALMASGYRPHAEAFKAAASICGILETFLSSGFWKLEEVAVVTQGFDPLLVASPPGRTDGACGVVEPGPASGLPKSKQKPVTTTQVLSLPRHLSLLWQRADARNAVEPIVAFARKLLETEAAPSVIATPAPSMRKTIGFDDDDDDEKATLRVNGSHAVELGRSFGQPGFELVSQAIAGVVVQLLVTASMPPVNGAAQCPGLSNLLMSSPFDRLLLFGPQALEYLRLSAFALPVEEAADVFWRLGDDLQTYDSARSSVLQAFVLRFLHATVALWNRPGDADFGDIRSRALTLCEWFTASHLRGNIADWGPRRDFAAFLDAFLEHDPSESGWSRDGRPLAKGPDGSPVGPQELLTRLLADTDFRVRFQTLPSVPHRLEILRRGQEMDVIWADINAHIVADGVEASELEVVVTQTLCHANVMVACAEIRPLAFEALVRACMDAGVTANVKLLLSKAASRLGLPSSTTFYELYAPHVCRSVIRSTPDMVNYPPQLVGEGLDIESGLCHLRAIVPELFFCGMMHRVDAAARRIGSDRSRALRICFPDIVTRIIADAFTPTGNTASAPASTVEGVARMQDQIRGLAASCAPQVDGSAIDVLLLERDRILATLLLGGHEGSPGQLALADEAHTASYFAGNRGMAKQFLQLIKGMGPVVIARPGDPFVPASVAFQAAAWFGTTYDTFSDPAILQNAASAIFLACSQHPFVDGKHRAIFALSGLIALASKRISTSATLLAALLLNVQPLLADENTATSVAGIVDWLVRHLLDDRLMDTALSPSVLALLSTTLSHVQVHHEGSQSASQSIAGHLATVLRDRLSAAASSHPSSFLQRSRVFWADERESLAIDDLIDALRSRLPEPLRFRLVHRFVDTGMPPSETAAAGVLHDLLHCALKAPDISMRDALVFVRLVSDRGVLPAAVDEQATAKSTGVVPVTSEDDLISEILQRAILVLGSPDMAHQKAAMDFVQRATLHMELPEKALAGADDLSARRARFLAARSIQKPYETLFITQDSDLLSRPDAIKLGSDHKQWTRLLAVDLAQTRSAWRPVYRELRPLLELDDAFASQVLPRLVHACLLGEMCDEAEPTTGFKDAFSAHLAGLLAAPSTDMVVIERIIDIVAYLRYHPRPQSGLLGFDAWLDVDWLSLTQHAVRLNLPSHAALFLELASEHGSSDRSQGVRGRIRPYAHQVYAAAEEPDSFYSAMSADPTEAILQRYQHEGSWDAMLGLHGAILQASESQTTSKAITGVVSSLASTGFHRLASMLLNRGAHEPNRDSLSNDDEAYDLAWRCSNWDLPVKNVASSAPARLYAALRTIHNERDLGRSLSVVDDCLKHEWHNLLSRSSRLGSVSSSPVEALVVFDDLRRWLEDEQASVPFEGTRTERLERLGGIGFDGAERLAAVRFSLLNGILKAEAALQVGDERSPIYRAARSAEINLRIALSQRCRSMGRPQLALNAIVPVVGADEPDQKLALMAQEEFARVLWKKGEQTVAIDALAAVHKAALQSRGLYGAPPAQQLARLGKWLGLARVREPLEIVENYFEPALESLDRKAAPDAFGRAALSFAVFVDDEYRTLLESGRVAQLRQMQGRRSQSLDDLRRQKDDLNRITQTQIISQISSAISNAQKIYKEDEEQLRSLTDLQNRYLKLALTQYISALTYGDSHEEVVFRFVSLWFGQHEDDALNTTLQPLTKQIPTWKLVRAAHQLCARLHKSGAPEQAPFQKTLSMMVIRLSRDHPFHMLFRLLALRHGLPSQNSQQRLRRSSTMQLSQVGGSQLSRANAADDVLHEVKKDTRLAILASHAEVAFAAYHEWAQFNAKQDERFKSDGGKRKVDWSIPTSFAIRSLRDLPLPVTTIDLPVDKSCVYPPEGMPCIAAFDLKFSIPGGVNAPKLTTCRASDGHQYKALYKGGDDLRQDAVMEQVFELFNELLRQDPECKTRYLRIRTYKIIVLSPSAGIIEHVGNTATLHNILCNLHDRFNSPPDYKVGRVRDSLSDVRGQSEAVRVQAYKDLMKRIRPAMRYHLLHTQRNPTRWYRLRLNYTRSVATTSIIGHILGIGDRHVSNLMLDNRTGELVPIDLGIAFDAGKRLAIPERVPFRLTPDMIDGFGLSGTEGVFRRCCEHTLRVLREKKSILMTIIEVLKYDPLQVWTLSSVKASKIQAAGSENEGGNSDRGSDPDEDVFQDAERVLASVANKLSSDLSVETVVNGLIVEATSIVNLGAMYHGWSPFL